MFVFLYMYSGSSNVYSRIYIELQIEKIFMQIL